MIEVRDLVYEYPTKRALHGVTLTVQPQTITALVGPNGAGKTTLMRCLAALATPYAGEIHVDGFETRAQPRQIHARVGYLPDFYGLYDALSVKRCLIFAARAHGLAPEKAEPAALKAAERVGLMDRLDRPAAELSRGLRQRLAIGQAIVHEPKLLLLDEPAAGLDPQARKNLSDLLVELKDHGMTLLVSSHILSELEDYSSQMIILNEGRVVGGGPMQVREDARAVLRIDLAMPRSDLGRLLAAKAGVELVEANESSATVRFMGDGAARAKLLRELLAGGLEVSGFAEAPHQLEQTYFAEVKGNKP